MVEAPSNRSAMITKEHQTGVIPFWCIGQKIEEGIHIKEKVCRISRLRTNDVWTLDWIATKEDWLQDVRLRTVGGDNTLTKLSPTMS
jgi:hypothetical protein